MRISENVEQHHDNRVTTAKHFISTYEVRRISEQLTDRCSLLPLVWLIFVQFGNLGNKFKIHDNQEI